MSSLNIFIGSHLYLLSVVETGSDRIVLGITSHIIESFGRKAGKMTNYDNTRRNFIAGFILVQLLSLLAVVIAGVWTGKYLGGFSWHNDLYKQFNYHILFMVIGFVYLYGNGMLIYRLLSFYEKKTLKIIHAVHFIGGFILVVVALQAVFDFHNLQNIPMKNLYSLHSWIGLGTVIIYSIQMVFGLVAYLSPFVSQYWKAFYMPIHRYFGVAIFLLIISCCLTGITEKLLYMLRSGSPSYADLPEVAIFGNILGVVLVILAVCMVYFVIDSSYKRQPIPEDNVAIQTTYLESS